MALRDGTTITTNHGNQQLGTVHHPVIPYYSGSSPVVPATLTRAVVLPESEHMSEPPKVNITNLPEYRENYANSVQIRASLWDFLLMFGLANQQTADAVNIQN